MPLTKEQLLIPRYLCTGTPGKPLWEGSPFFHGAIYQGEIYRLMNLGVSGHTDYNFSNMPHLFKPLPWWYGRKPEDMPEYLKFSYTDEPVIHKVKKWVKDKHCGCVADCGFGGFSQVMNEYISPASRSEYDEYLKQKEG